MNMAGLQRSLSQRMVKNYLMLGADVRVDAAQRQLQETVEHFDASQKALAGYAPTAEIKAALAKVDATWAVHRQQVEAKPECSTWPSPGVCLRRALDAKLDKAVSDFETILKELEARGTPNEEIADTQRRARAHWGFTLKGIDLHNTQSSVPTVSADSLFRQLNELTRLYAGLQADE